MLQMLFKDSMSTTDKIMKIAGFLGMEVNFNLLPQDPGCFGCFKRRPSVAVAFAMLYELVA